MTGADAKAASAPAPLSEELRARTLERFEDHRRAWAQNRALRALYADLYARIAAELPPEALGPRVELGSGPGLARDFIPGIVLTDLVGAPWHDREASAEALPFVDGSVGALVLFDVLHHLPSPPKFFAEAVRVLPRGGRIVMCEPYVSPVSWPVYKFLHEEPLDLGADPLAVQATAGDARDPFDANQAIPTLMFGRNRAAFEAAFPALAIQRVQHMTGFSFPASGGFSHRPFLPWALWSLLHRFDAQVPAALMRWMAFRMLVVIERV